MALAENLVRRLRDPRARWVLVLVALLVLAGVYVALHPRQSRALRGGRVGMEVNVRREPAGLGERAVLAPLTESSEIGAWRITMVEGLRDGLIHVLLRRGADTMEVVIARREGTVVSPPLTEGPYALFHFSASSLDREAMTVMRALAAALHRNAAVPVPAGLRPFTPHGSR